MKPDAAPWVVDALRQTHTWTDEHGRAHRVDDMLHDQRRALLHWLRQHATELHAAWLEAMRLEPVPQLHEDQLRQTAAILAHRERDPGAWLDTTPLVRRLVALERRFLGMPRRWWR